MARPLGQRGKANYFSGQAPILNNVRELNLSAKQAALITIKENK
jgi:hypothetical protein